MGTSKVCVLCGNDCAGKPRVKDAKGKYYCKACHEQALVGKSDARDVGLGDAGLGDAMLDDLLSIAEPAASSSEPCASCGQPLASDAMLCVNCGYNRKTGQAMQTAAVAVSTAGRRSSGRVWPLVIGVISVCWAGLMLLLQSIEIMIRWADESMTPFSIANVVQVLIWGTLLVGAIQLLMRKPKGPANMRAWSHIVILLSILGLLFIGFVLAMSSGQHDTFQQGLGVESELEATIMLVAGGILLIAQLACAIFLVLWFRRDAVQQEIASW